jgi:hypothetical protein
MLASISPLGERARQQRYAITVTAYVVASTLAGALLGGVLGAVGAPFAGTPAAIAVLAALAIAGLLLDGHVFGWRVPGPRRQVNEDWLATYRGWVYGAGYGAQLGLGVTTIITSSVTWVALACAAAAGSWAGGMIVGIAFGLTRALTILLTAHVRDATTLRVTLARLERVRPRVARATNVLQAAIAAGLLVAITAQVA